MFIRENTLEQLNEICDNIKLVNRKDLPKDEDIAEMINKRIFYKDGDNILTWDRIFFANYTILYYYKKDFFTMPNFSDFLEDLMDYLYIINLDKNKFDVYKMKLSDERKDEEDEGDLFKKYKLLKSFDLNNIPRDWEFKLD